MLKLFIWLWMTLVSSITCATSGAAEYPPPSFVDNADCSSISRQQLELTEVTISDGARSADILAEVARTPNEQQQGLMCRSSVPEGTGMVFLFDGPRSGGFWMYNTYAPLDIIFANGDEAIAVFPMEPCPRSAGEPDAAWSGRCSGAAAGYRPQWQYTSALELPQGWLESKGFSTDNPQAITLEYRPASDN
jgi:uncharacterized membrane protein (UPF0127 family)